MKIEEFPESTSILLLGAEGKLGKEFSFRLTRDNISFYPIDTRNRKFGHDLFGERFFVLDLSGHNSRVKEPPEVSSPSSHLGVEFLEYVNENRIPYLKIATAFTLHKNHQRNQYALSSESQISELTDMFRKLPFPLTIAFSHSVYGGEHTRSIVDQLKNCASNSTEIILVEPNNVRDFVHIELFYQEIFRIMTSDTFTEPKYAAFEIGTGHGYRIQDIANYRKNFSQSLDPMIRSYDSSPVDEQENEYVVAGFSSLNLLLAEDWLPLFMRQDL